MKVVDIVRSHESYKMVKEKNGSQNRAVLEAYDKGIIRTTAPTIGKEEVIKEAQKLLDTIPGDMIVDNTHVINGENLDIYFIPVSSLPPDKLRSKTLTVELRPNNCYFQAEDSEHFIDWTQYEVVASFSFTGKERKFQLRSFIDDNNRAAFLNVPNGLNYKMELVKLSS